MKHYLMTFNANWGDEHEVPALEVFTESELKTWMNMKIYLNAQLGNNGDNFVNEMQGKLGKQFIKEGYVTKKLVTEEFAKTFHKSKLAELSLSDIFDIDIQQEKDDDFDEEEFDDDVD